MRRLKGFFKRLRDFLKDSVIDITWLTFGLGNGYFAGRLQHQGEPYLFQALCAGYFLLMSAGSALIKRAEIGIMDRDMSQLNATLMRSLTSTPRPKDASARSN